MAGRIPKRLATTSQSFGCILRQSLVCSCKIFLVSVPGQTAQPTVHMNQAQPASAPKDNRTQNGPRVYEVVNVQGQLPTCDIISYLALL